MATVFTNNFDLPLPTVSAEIGVWGNDINSNLTAPLDAILGGATAITMTSSDVTLTVTQFQSKAFNITGTLTTNVNLKVPQSVNQSGGTPACGGHFIVYNNTTGAFTITVTTAGTGAVGVVVPQGQRTSLFADPTNNSVFYADDSVGARFGSYPGNPNGNVAGVAGSVNTPASVIWDRTDNFVWVCTTTGTATTAVWAQVTGSVPQPQGYLTPISGTPIITGDSIGATTIYYTPYVGQICPIWNGTSWSPVQFTQQAVALSGTQAGNNLHDVFAFLNSGVFTVAFGPPWSAGTGGNQTAGSCARGTGAGGAALARVGGLLTNAALISAANNGASTYSIAANQGTYLGTIYVDASSGQVTCHRTIGQNRKWGIYNQFNKSRTALRVADPTTSWLYLSTTIRASNNTPASWSSAAFNVGSGTTCNGMTVLTGLAEEEIDCSMMQKLLVVSSGGSQESAAGIGINSVSSRSGTWADMFVTNNSYIAGVSTGRYVSPPQLGITTVCAVESCIANNSSSNAFLGTEAFMALTVEFGA